MISGVVGKKHSPLQSIREYGARSMVVCLISGFLVASTLQAQELVGTWKNESGGTEMTFSFSEDGTGTWDVLVAGEQGFSDSYAFDYIADYEVVPHYVDIMNIDHGFLAGKTMYGIFSLDGEGALILDFEPGPPGESSVRPADFTDDAVTLTGRLKPSQFSDLLGYKNCHTVTCGV